MGCCWPRPRPASPPQPTLAAAPNDDAGKGEGKGLGAEDSGAAEEASGEAKMPSDASQAAPLRSLTEHQKYVSWLATAARLEREDPFQRPRPKAWRIHGICSHFAQAESSRLGLWKIANSFDEARFAWARLQNSECGIVLL